KTDVEAAAVDVGQVQAAVADHPQAKVADREVALGHDGLEATGGEGGGVDPGPESHPTAGMKARGIGNAHEAAGAVEAEGLADLAGIEGHAPLEVAVVAADAVQGVTRALPGANRPGGQAGAADRDRPGAGGEQGCPGGEGMHPRV